MNQESFWDPIAIADLLCRCGRNSLTGRGRKDWSLKADGSLLTALDVANEGFLKSSLTALRPGSYFLGEETLSECSEEYLSGAFSGDCWVVDPIDGTAPFANGYPCWGVSIGLMREGTLTDGGVILPEAGILMVTSGRKVLSAGGVDVLEKRPLLAFSAMPGLDYGWDDGRMILLGQELARRYVMDAPNPIFVSGSAVYSIVSLLLGRGLLYAGTFKLYDIAGTFPIMERLGLAARTVDGRLSSMNITEDTFHLKQDDPQRWKIRGIAMISTSAVLDVAADKLNLARG